MTHRFSNRLFAGCLFVITFVASTLPIPTYAQLFNSPVDRLPVAERVALREGKALVTGENGKYIAKILVTASPETVWGVLTDYNNFPKFLPNVVSSQILQKNGNRKVVEQVDARQVLLMNVRSRLRMENVETHKTRIDFKLIEGDLKQLKGYWLLEPVSAYPGAKSTQILVTQQVEVQPTSATPKGIFNNIFKESLQSTLQAISKEIGRRKN